MPLARQFRGAFTALITPFTPTGAIDEDAFRALVRRQIDSCIHGLVACGTTGETPTLSHEEDEWVIGTTLEIANERPSRARVRVIAGTGSNSTATAIRATRRAAEIGVDAALVVAPYYNKPDQRMLESHFLAVAEEGDLPIIVYNVPGRTGVNVEAATLLRLAEHPRIVAVKEASANMDQIATILAERPADSPSSRATTPGRCRCWRWAATASSAPARTRSPARWPRCATRRSRATGIARG
jgi:4-hydroxy-tetrahydrodipicolinate synthase